ncbi:hypothetical protein CUT44_13805 [Streptomyces carminius]|uniref:Guanylate cyclase domain-containing protein n=1 Tax=Streptomyces carminius TaxID=2665496 RepID=A0A2M8LZ35_9ACTN|nr:hypothetical protein [Streptomyces carminius]PJE97212.1 hypothetical protein CUT44_13805 [Streptomyces carminius]
MSPSPLPNAVDVPPERALLVVDMKGYSQIPEAKMAPVRSDLDDILTTVFIQSGLSLPASEDGAYKDTGDGAIFVLPDRDAARLIDPLLGHLNDALTRYDKTRLASTPPIRLRASVHTGPLSLPDHRGDAINDACRLISSDAVRQAMTAALEHGSFLAAVVSEVTFRRTVRAGRTDLQENQFLPATARVQDKPDFKEPCRVLVPRVPPALISPYLTEESDVPPPHLRNPAAQAPAGSRKTGERSAPVRQKAKASGHAQVVQVGGDQITYRPEQP